MNKFCLKAVNNLFNLILLIVGATITFGKFINADYFSPFRIFLFIFVFVLFWQIIKQISIFFDNFKKNDFFFSVCLFLFVVLAFFFFHYFAVNPSWDYGMLYGIAKKICWQIPLENAEISYLAVYPWNYMMLYTYVAFFHFFEPSVFSLFCLGLGCIVLSLCFIYCALRNFLSSRQLFQYEIFLFLFFPFLFYTVLPYTHVLALFFISIICWLLVRIKDKLSWKNVLFLSILIAIGSLYKILVFIFGISLMIVLLIKKRYNLIIIPILSFFILRFLFFNWININEISYLSTAETKTSFLHYLYLGSNYETHGRYSDEDAHYAYEYCLLSANERNQFYIHAIQSRFKEMGFQKAVMLYMNKILDTWGDGLYFADNKLQREPLKYEAINEFFLYGKGYTIIRNFAQFIHIGLFMLIILGNWNQRDKRCEILILKLVILGLFIYLLIFETRSRYVFSFIPVLYLLSALQLKKIEKKEDYFKEKIKKVIE